MAVASELGIRPGQVEQVIYYAPCKAVQLTPTEQRVMRMLSSSYREVVFEPFCGHCGSPFVKLEEDERSGQCLACEGKLINV